MRHCYASFILMGVVIFTTSVGHAESWESKYLTVNEDHSLRYVGDQNGNIIPDFSYVGYYRGDRPIPEVPIVKSIAPTGQDDGKLIQSAIDEVAKKTLNADGFRGTILLRKGTYHIPGTVHIHTSGIVLRGEGDHQTGKGTKLIAEGKGQRALIKAMGSGTLEEQPNTRVKITDDYVPAGAFSFHIDSTKGFKVGDEIVVYRPGTEKWIKDLKMDQIIPRTDGKAPTHQWKPDQYNLSFERVITKIQDNLIFIDNPIVLPMERQYGGGEVFKYTFDGRINHVGIENIYFESEFVHDKDEDHGWDAIFFDAIENSWIRNVTARHFGFACVNLSKQAKFITVSDCRCEEAKSIITGSRRYSFNNDGQMNLFMNCHAQDGRHDYVTGAKVCGPNVFYNCTAIKTHSDIGPHHRWSSGTLYDNITTDGEINVQDRGNLGSGHGWTGVTQVIWNCTAKKAVIQSPWISGRNYCIGLQGEQSAGRFSDRSAGEWEGQNKKGLKPSSLYLAQLSARQKQH